MARIIPVARIDPLAFHLKRTERLLARGFDYRFEKETPDKSRLPESDAVHLVTEIRKILELTDSKAKFPFLRFACDWPLHTSIDRSDIPAEIFRKLTNTIIYGQQNVQAWIRPLEDITFGAFRKDLNGFLSTHQLPKSLVESDEEWKSFLEGYVFLVAGCPLKFNRTKADAQRKRIRTRRKWGLNEKISTLTLMIVPPFDTRRDKSSRGSWNPRPSLKWEVEHDNGHVTTIPCIFYSFKHPIELELWQGLIWIDAGATLK